LAEQNTTANTGHPRGLYVLFVTEMWERFSYYGMRAIFVLYMTKAILLTSAEASNIYGSYTGLVYLTPLLGGYISDRYWGNRRSIFVGGLLMAIGQFCLFFSAMFSGTDYAGFVPIAGQTINPLSITMMWVGLFFLIFGNGFFKPNISTMVGQLYPKGDRRVDSAFTIFYMGINLGAFFSPIVCGALGENIAFRWGFLAAGIGMLLSVVFFEMFKDKYVVDADGKAVGGLPVKIETETNTTKGGSQFNVVEMIIWLAIYFGVGAFFKYVAAFDLIGTFIFTTTIVGPAWIIMDKALTSIERQRIWAIYIIAFFVIFFWAAFEQAGASLTIFADKNTDRFLFGWEVPASLFQSVNAVAIVLFAPIFAWLWTFLGSRKLEPSSPLKQAIGLFLLAMSYFVIAFGVKGVDAQTKVSMLWLLSLYLIQTYGELCLSPIGLSMVNKLAPMRLASLLMGVWFLSTAAANKFAGTLSALLPVIDTKTNTMIATNFAGYQIANLYDFFMLFMFMSLAASIILFLLYKWLLKLMHGIE
jgi:POT family proton-dependent oligopeptide transporter